MAMMATAGIGYGSRGLYAGQAPYPAGVFPSTGVLSHSQAPDAQESTYLYIPNNAVGAIIGTKVSKTPHDFRVMRAEIVAGLAYPQHHPLFRRFSENRSTGRDEAARNAQ